MISKLKEIAATSSAGVIDGYVFDNQAATSILKLYNALDSNGQRKFAALPVERLAGIAIDASELTNPNYVKHINLVLAMLKTAIRAGEYKVDEVVG